jgi:putative hydrolase of the HAD superfamily
MIRALLFDLDGTLFDRTASVTVAIQRQYDRFAAQLSSIAKEDYLARFLALEERGYVKKEIVYQRIAEGSGWPVDLAETLCADYYRRYHEYCVGFPGLEAVLGELKALDLKLGIITNGREAMQRGVIQELGIESHFDAILISEVEGIRKPDIRIFQRALERVGATATNTLFIGDHPEFDIDGAQKAGMRTIWKRDDYWGACRQADWTINDLHELLPLVKTLSTQNGAHKEG